MKRTALVFTGPGLVELRDEPLPPLPPDQLAVRCRASAISPGTEMLIYRGQAPVDLPVDETLPSLSGDLAYPLHYGYAAVGQVVEVGSRDLASWQSRRVFAFQPHASAFHAPPDQLIPLPDEVTWDQALFLPNLETAINLVQDGAPLYGEMVVVFGQGIVGLLTTSLLARFPLDLLVTLDVYEGRRRASLGAGAHLTLHPMAADMPGALDDLFDGQPPGADLAYELSGDPRALDQAIKAIGFDGRVVIGSWYGQKRAPLDLGSHFHRNRIRLISSQVSTIRPTLRGRWTKKRRLAVALKRLKEIQPDRWITQRYPIERAAEAYHLIDKDPDQTIQVLLTY